jgi:choice-of-anchor B domain-containing protein
MTNARLPRRSTLISLTAALILATALLPAGAAGHEALDAKDDGEAASAPATPGDPTLPMPTEPIGFTPCTDGMAGPFPCHNTDLLTFWPPSSFGGGPGSQYGGPGNDVWGWTDPETGSEWILFGRSNGTSFVDISDPTNPVFAANLPRHMTNELHADIKTYRHYALVVSEGSGNGMQVFDLTRLRDIDYDDAPVTVDADAHYPGFGNAHDVVVNEDSGFAYGVGTGSGGGNVCTGGLHMVDVRDPLNPTYAGCYNDDGYTHDAQCVIYHGPDERYRGREICFLANPNPSSQGRVTVVDVTDKANPVMLSRALQGPPYAYSHQGWLTEDHRYFLHDDESDEIRNGGRTRTRIFDTSNLTEVALHSVYHGETFAADHNLYVKEQHAYLTNYWDGLRVVDLTEIDSPGSEPAPETPGVPDAGGLREVGCFDTDPARNDYPGFGGSWSNYPWYEDGVVVVSGFDGLFVLRTNVDEDSTGGGVNGCIVNAHFASPAFDPDFTFEGDTATVSGSVEFPESTGPESVGGNKSSFNSNTAAAGAAAGLELVDAKIAPIEDRLRFIWEVGDLPDPQTGVLPEVVRYDWNLRIEGTGTGYQLEAKRTGLLSANTAEDPLHHVGRGAEESFRLRGDCGNYNDLPVPECHHLSYLEGSFDYENDRVTIDWPYETMDHLGNVVAPDFTPEATLLPATFQGMSISAAFQPGTTTSSNAVSNSINGWNAYHVEPLVQLVAGPAGERPTRLTFGPTASRSDHSFTGQVSGVDDASNTVYVRACARSSCGYASLRVS